MVASEEQKDLDDGAPRVIAPVDDVALDDARRSGDRRILWRGALLSFTLHAAIIIALLGLWQWAPPPEIILHVALVTEGPGAAGATGGAGGEAATAGNAADAGGTPAAAPAPSSAAAAAAASAPAAATPPEPMPTEPAPPSPQAAAPVAAPPPPTPAPTRPKPLPPRPRRKPRAPASPTPAPMPTPDSAPPAPQAAQQPRPQPTQAAPPPSAAAPQQAPSSAAGDKTTAAPAAAGVGTGPAGPGGVGQGSEGQGHGIVGNGPQDGPGDDYLDRLRRWLARYKKYPEEALKRKVEGKVVVSFTLARDGTVLSAQVEKSSGNPLLDQAAVQMLHDASPVPPVPERYKGRELRLTIPVDYSIGLFERLFR